MKKSTMITLVCALPIMMAGPALAGLDQHLQPLERFIGKTFEGRTTDEATGKTVVDVQIWEAILGGKAVRTVHSVNDGEYGGESIITWNPAAGELIFYYFTTAGFYTHGPITFDASGFTTQEKVEGEAGGVSEVRSTGRFLDNGGLHITSEFLMDGEWQAGGEMTYVENPDAKVVFE